MSGVERDVGARLTYWVLFTYVVPFERLLDLFTTWRFDGRDANWVGVAPLRAITRRVFAVFVFVAARAMLPELPRGTTRRADVEFDKGLVLTTTSIGLVDCDTVTPGFRSVRI